MSQSTPLGFPSTPSVIRAMNTCEGNNIGKRPNTPGNATTADWCRIYNFCNMQDPNAQPISSPGRATTLMPPNDITGTKTYSEIYSSEAKCEASCQGLNDAYFFDFKNSCSPGTSAIRNNNSKHNNPDALESGPYNPLYFDGTPCVQTQYICSPSVLQLNSSNPSGYDVPTPTTFVKQLSSSPGQTPDEINCNRIAGYIYSNNICKINSNQPPPPGAADPSADPSSPGACPKTPAFSSSPGNDASSVAQNMGMNQNCTQNETDAQMGASEEANVTTFPFGPTGEEHASAYANAHHQQTSGCAQRNAQVSTFNSAKSAVACTLVDTSNNATVDMKSKQNITYVTKLPGSAAYALVENLTTLCVENEAKGLSIPFCSTENLALVNKNLDASINITESDLLNIMKNSVSVQMKTNSTNIQNTAVTFTDSVKQATTATLTNMIGSNALPLNANQLIDQGITDHQTVINDAITQLSQSVEITDDNVQGITLISAGAINITNSTVDNNMVNNVNASSLVTSATQIGQQIAAEIVAKMNSTDTDSTKIAGEDAMINALGLANAEGIEAHVENNGMIIAIVIIVCVIVLGGGIFAVIKMSVSKNSSVQSGSGDSSVPSSGSGDSSVKSSAFYNRMVHKKSKMLNIENGDIDYGFIANISLAFCIFILFMFLICKKK